MKRRRSHHTLSSSRHQPTQHSLHPSLPTRHRVTHRVIHKVIHKDIHKAIHKDIHKAIHKVCPRDLHQLTALSRLHYLVLPVTNHHLRGTTRLQLASQRLSCREALRLVLDSPTVLHPQSLPRPQEYPPMLHRWDWRQVRTLSCLSRKVAGCQAAARADIPSSKQDVQLRKDHLFQT